METAKISNTGQTTIPAPIREFLQITKGDRLLFEIDEKREKFIDLDTKDDLKRLKVMFN